MMTTLPGSVHLRNSMDYPWLNTHQQLHEQLSVGDFEIGEVLGKGSFGVVKLGTHPISKQKVALKFIDYQKCRTAKDRENVKREIELMKSLDHPNIVRLYDVIEIPENNSVCLVMEYIEAGELFTYISDQEKLEEVEAARFFSQLLDAINYCHKNLLIHRDLKLENILLDENKNVKITDFGLSNLMKPGYFLNTFCGSPLYTAPEVISEKAYIGPEVDIWSLGVILYAMVTGMLPWEGESMQDQVRNVLKASYEVPDDISDECKHLICRMLTKDPKKRATLDELMVHPWLNMSLERKVPKLNANRLTRSCSRLDETVISNLEQLGFRRQEIIRAITQSAITEQSYMLYFLILDNKKLKKQNSINSMKSASGTWPSKRMSGNPPPSSRSMYDLLASQDDESISPSMSPCKGAAARSFVDEEEKPKEKHSFWSSLFSKKAASPPPSPTMTSTSSHVQSKTEIQEKNLRVSKGSFSSDIISTKPLPEILSKFEEAFNTLNLKYLIYSKENRYTILDPDCEMTIEICKIHNLDGFKGYKFKKISGKTTSFEFLKQQILKEMK